MGHISNLNKLTPERELNTAFLVLNLYLFCMLNLLFLFFSAASAQTPLLKSGPMLGYATQTEVTIWVQTTSEANVRITYSKKYSKESFLNSMNEVTKKEKGYCTKLKIGNLEPATRYNYELFINDNKVSFSYPLEFQTNSIDTVRDFKIALGSCAVLTEDTAINRIYESIAAKNPDLMLWLGDNIYMDKTDWGSLQNMIRKYAANRSLSQLQPLLASTHHFAIWDDHDYGPDNSDSCFYNKRLSREAFEIFWANPSFGIDEKGITTSFSWYDVDFFLLDNRYNRAPDLERNKRKPYLGETQIQWLIASLKNSKARFKIIASGNQVICKVPFDRENYSSYKREWKSLFKELKKSCVEGILFVTGDRHFSEISMKKRRGTYPLYDLTVSPLTSGPVKTKFIFNTNRVRKSLIGRRNFAVLEFCGSGPERTMKINYYDTEGALLYQNILPADCFKNK